MKKTLSREKARLIVCTVLNPFVSGLGMMYETGHGYEAVPGAEKIKIDDLLVGLYENDQRHNLTLIDFIMTTLARKCHGEGFSVSLEKKELIGRKFKTVGELAARLTESSKSIWT